MNFLAHCFLSFGDEDVLLGNFIGDFVKGSAWKAYGPGVQRGILTHRVIDGFTDTHEAVGRSVARIRPFAGRYAAPVIDVLYDFLLARDWETYAAEPHDAFCRRVYALLGRREAEVPDLLRLRLPHMLAARFLHEYTSEAGMYQVMARFSRRVPLEADGRVLLEAFFAEQEAFEADFAVFFPLLIGRVKAIGEGGDYTTRSS